MVEEIVVERITEIVVDMVAKKSRATAWATVVVVLFDRTKLGLRGREPFWSEKHEMAIHPKAKEIAPHVHYELWMLTESIRRLWMLQREPAVDEFQKNLFIEAILTHARVIHEFLFSKRREKFPQDVRAAQFFEGAGDWSPDQSALCPYFNKTNLDRLQRSVHHLSYDRLVYEENKLWNFGALGRDIVNAWNTFFSQLPKERQAWFSGEM
jgi:hypothetical protein